MGNFKLDVLGEMGSNRIFGEISKQQHIVPSGHGGGWQNLFDVGFCFKCYTKWWKHYENLVLVVRLWEICAWLFFISSTLAARAIIIICAANFRYFTFPHHYFYLRDRNYRKHKYKIHFFETPTSFQRGLKAFCLILWRIKTMLCNKLFKI